MLAEGLAPRDFFYGILELERLGYDIVELNGAEPYSGPLSLTKRIPELLSSHITRIGLRPNWVAMHQPELTNARVAVSYTDGMSLTLGSYYADRCGSAPFLAGCFHGLSDIEPRAPKHLRSFCRERIGKALRRLDLVSFFGPADRDYAIERYRLDPDRCHLFLFGVDTDFWSPAEETATVQDRFVSVGSDPSRDYQTLIDAVAQHAVVLLTRLPVSIPAGKQIELLQGSYWAGKYSDQQIRGLYRDALAVVVPLKDVYQPTGYSVTLQAMACGKPVILSRIRGLWTPEVFRDGENCLLVTPGKPEELRHAMQRLAEDPDLRRRLGDNARSTAEAHWSLDRSVASSREIFDRALAARMTR